jgi:hypothetical protein
MKHQCLIYFGLLLLPVASSCQSENESNEGKLSSDLTEVLDKVGKTAEEFKGKLDELLTLDMASKTSGYESKLAEKEYRKGGSFESLKYVWKKTNRTRRVEFIKGSYIDAPVEDRIELSWVKNTTLEEFKRNYHNLTKEEIAKAEAAMDTKLKEMQADGKVSESQAKAASSIAKSSLGNQRVTDVPNLGDYSVFVESKFIGAEMKDLKVFYRGLSFNISVDLSNDQAYNDKKAIEVARLIIKEKL